MEPRISIMKSQQLAGIACWKLGLESASLWNVIYEAYGR
jgi:spore germination protein YaaH